MLSLVPSMILLTLALTSVWVSSRLFGHPISPFSIFYGVWFFTLALFFLRWVEYTPVRGQAWQLIVLNLASFGFGWILAYLFQRPGMSNWKIELAAERLSPQRLRKVIYVSFALGMVGLAEFLRRVQGLLGLGTYLVAPHEIREATLFMEDRTRFFFALLWAGYVLVHVCRWNTRKLLATGLVLTAVLALQFFVVAAWLGKVAINNSVLMEATNISVPFFPLLTPYMYLTGSYPALQAYLDTRPDSTAGAMTFYPAHKVLRLLNPSLKVPEIVAEPVAVPSEVNTFTWLHQFYTDFGVAGVILGPLGVAFLSGLIYFHMLQTKDFYSLYANGLISFGFTLSFMVNHLTAGPVWYFLAVGIPIARYITRPVPALAQR